MPGGLGDRSDSGWACLEGVSIREEATFMATMRWSSDWVSLTWYYVLSLILFFDSFFLCTRKALEMCKV